MTENLDNSSSIPDARSAIPSVSVVLEHRQIRGMIDIHSRPMVLDAIRDTLNELRQGSGDGEAAALDSIVAMVSEKLKLAEFQRLRRVINASGIILHTGLGRAVLPQAAVDAMAEMNSCCNLQIDLETGLRGKRNFETERLLCHLTGAQAAMVVNNNAAATMLVLCALCNGKEVVVSRGQLIEIGGSFRLPDCISQSGARMVEVGTTNKTHLRDYENAIGPETGALLRVNPSNYRIIGFTKDVPVLELVSLKAGRDLLVIDDLGCGAIVDLRQFGLPHEPTVQESVWAGADLVLFSGDKLIGGAQAGIIVGRKDLISRLKKHPLTRMLRVGKMTDLVLEHTLRLFLNPDELSRANPTLRMLTTRVEDLQKRATELVQAARAAGATVSMEVKDATSEIGGGALPGESIPTKVISLNSSFLTASKMAALLRQNEPPVITRIEREQVLIDTRTLLEGEGAEVAAAIARLR